jgi:hypothetical protein
LGSYNQEFIIDNEKRKTPPRILHALSRTPGDRYDRPENALRQKYPGRGLIYKDHPVSPDRKFRG